MLEKKIAIVDDNPSVRSTLCEVLKANGYEPIPFADSGEFSTLGENPKLDLAIIDLHLGGESGLDLVQSIRTSNEFPIIMFTGVGDEIDKIIGLEAGADDYLMKPLNTRELIARIRAVLRRYGKSGIRYPASVAMASPHVQHIGNFNVSFSQRRVFAADGTEITLTNSEFRLLEYFLKNPNQVVERVELLRHLGSDCTEYIDRSIDVLILRLRRKIEPCPSKPTYLQTRRGKGYVFVLDEHPTMN